MRMPHLLYATVALLALAWANAQAMQYSESKGIELENTRVIYPGKAKKGITFTVKNQTDFVYLLQSRVIPWAESTKKIASEAPAPFIVLPPLVRFAPGEDISLRIRLTNNALPQDRESIFTLSLKAIPSQAAPDSTAQEGDTSVVLALQNNLKLFYRPENIALMNNKERAEALTFSRQGKQLAITNPTPYYITLGEVSIDKAALNIANQRMLAPFSTATYSAIESKASAVSWQIIDDEGRTTALQVRALN